MNSKFLKSVVAAGFALGAATFGQDASADVLHWQTVIGIIQGGNVVGTGAGAVTGAPGPWSALGGHVTVDTDRGDVDVDIRGLVFAAGNTIGTRGAVAQVRGTLVCDANGSATGGLNSVIVETPLFDLDEEGDAHFSANLGALPAVCSTEADVAFLIRAANGKWIGNAAVLR